MEQTNSNPNRKKRQKVEVNWSNPFKAVEKKYKAYKNVDTNFEDVIDFYSISNNTPENKSKIVSVPNSDNLEIYTLSSVEGLFFIKNHMSIEEQEKLVSEIVYEAIEPPNISNLDAFHGPQHKLFSTFKDKSWDSLFGKLRWVTLGYHYNWTSRTYSKENYTPFPPNLAKLSEHYASKVGYHNFEAEAAIINFYLTDSTLCGHLDDVEEYMEMPIVSISFGNTAVFLIGGQSKDIEPTAIFVRSGDIVIMSGHSRKCYHGVPRILANTVPENMFSSDNYMKNYIKNARINLNVRQVYRKPGVMPDSNECKEEKEELSNEIKE